MENQIEIIDLSILSKISDLKRTMIKDEDTNVFHTIFSSNKSGISSIGSDYLEDNSLKKARSEFIERLVYKQFKNRFESTSGFAAHIEQSHAEISALKELIERDLFLTSWFSGYFPNWNCSLSKKFPYSKFNKLKIKIGEIGQCGEYQCFVYIVSNKEISSVCGTVCEKSEQEVIDKIIFDISRVRLILQSNPQVSTPHQNIQTPIDHFEYYLNSQTDYLNKTYVSKSSHPIKLKVPDHQFITFEFNKKLEFPISIVKCTSTEVQNYFTGFPIEGKVNSNRITNSIPKDRLIHPLG